MGNPSISRRSFGLGAATVAAVLMGACGAGSDEGDNPDDGGQSVAGDGKLTLAYNADGPHEAWVRAVCDSVSNTLGITMEPLPFAQFSELREQIDERRLGGAFRSEWRAEYPSPGSFLADTYVTGASANDSEYANAAFDGLMGRAAAAGTESGALGLYVEAQEQLLVDLPAIPLWYENGFGGYSARVSDVVLDWRGVPRFDRVTTTADDGVVQAVGHESRGSLVPTDVDDAAGVRLVDLLFAGLVSYETDGTVTFDVAESVETSDDRNFTVRLRPDQTFSDGTPVNADSFVKTWNYGALLSNAQAGRRFFAPIEGFSETKDAELTGVAKVDDLTFTVRLKEPASDFVARLGCVAFFPLPEVAWKDVKAYGRNPVGNGPYVLASLEARSRVVLTRNADYRGARAAKNEGVTFTFYNDPEAAYRDLLADSLDVLDTVPDSELATFATELGDRSFNGPAAAVHCIVVDVGIEHWRMDDEGRARRAAISRAVDREQICDTLYYGTRVPARDFTSPSLKGWTATIPGNEVLHYDRDEAVSKWAQAEAISPY